jgi:hypothetical protein
VISPCREATIYTGQQKHRYTFIPPMGFKPTISTFEQAKIQQILYLTNRDLTDFGFNRQNYSFLVNLRLCRYFPLIRHCVLRQSRCERGPCLVHRSFYRKLNLCCTVSGSFCVTDIFYKFMTIVHYCKYYVSGHYSSFSLYIKTDLFILQNTTFRRLVSVSVFR